MKTRQTIPVLTLILIVGALVVHAGNLDVRLVAGSKKHRVTLSVVVANNTDNPINLRPVILAETNVASSLTWQVNGKPAEFFPKRSFLMSPPFDTKTLPPHSTNAVVLVEDDELMFVTKTEDHNSRRAKQALPSTGKYTIKVETTGDWGGLPSKSAVLIVNIKKESPTKPCTLLPEGAPSGKK